MNNYAVSSDKKYIITVGRDGYTTVETRDFVQGFNTLKEALEHIAADHEM